MSFDAGAITSTLGLDISPFGRGMLEANAIAAVFPQTVQTFLANPLLGLISVAEKAAHAIKDAFTTIGHAADNAGEAAEKAGVSVEFLTSVGAVAKDAGSSVEGFGDALKFLNNNAADAASGNKVTAKAFGDLGVSVLDASGALKGTQELFFDVADAIAALPTPAQKVQAAMNLMGRGGSDMIATLNKGSGGIKEFAAQISALGGSIDEGLAAAGDKFGTLETIVDAAWAGIKKSVAQPILQFVADHFQEIVASVTEMAASVRAAIGEIMPSLIELIPTFTSVGGAIFSGMVSAFEAVLPLLKAVAPLIKSLADLVSSVLTPVFRVLAPVLEVVAKLLETIAKVIGGALSGAASVVRSITQGLGGGPDRFTQGVVDGARALGGKGGSVTIDGLTINVPGVDPSQSTDEIAAKVAGPIREAMRRAKAAEGEAANRRAEAAL